MMDKQQFQRELEYGAAIATAKAILRQSLITTGEYRKIKAALIERYRPVIDSLRKNGNSPRTG